MRKFPANILTTKERELLKALSTPEKIQDFVLTMAVNKKDTVQSVRRTIKNKKGHCFEGALLAAAALWYHGHPPLLLDLKTSAKDKDHVVTIFKRNGYYGAISTTSHSVLRYRDPIYKTLRELALSYFHEYFLNNGQKTLIGYSSKPFILSTSDTEWLTGEDELYDLGAALDDAPHTRTVPPKTKLRYADKIERRAANTTNSK